MPRTYFAVVFGAVVGIVRACPNHCSGHGDCDPGSQGVCACWQGWTGADCNARKCPQEIAFADHPTVDGTFHNFAECSGRGICDRSTGECECFDGYTGKACKRMTCPNGCSGHGTCERLEDLHFGSSPGEYWTGLVAGHSGLFTRAKTFENRAKASWDWDKGMKCKCDPGFTEFDCSRQMCPKGNDVLDTRLNTADTFKYQKQNITLFSAGTSGNGSDSSVSDFYNGSFALTFISKLNESYTTLPIVVESYEYTSLLEWEMAAKIASALKGLPNRVIDDVNVNVTVGKEERHIGVGFTSSTYDQAFISIEVEFSGEAVMGPQNLLVVEADECGEGCTPKLDGLSLLSYSGSDSGDRLSFVSEKQAADYNSYECGRRGKCDYDTGLCECFEGHVGEACTETTELV